MRSLNDRERRIVRLGAVGLAAYLVLFFGFKLWRTAERNRQEYLRLVQEARTLSDRLTVYDDKAALVSKLMGEFRFDPAKLARTSLVAQASAAIQQAAQMGGVMPGPIRETPGRGTGRELTTLQFEGQGPAPALLKFLHNLGSLGFPLVTESVQITAPPMGAGPVKVNLTIQVLDFDAGKPGEGRPNA